MQEMQETRVQSLGWEDPLEEEVAAHSSILAWRTWGTEEPGGLPFLGSHRVGHDWSDLAAAAAKGIHINASLETMDGGGRWADFKFFKETSLATELVEKKSDKFDFTILEQICIRST